MGDESRLWVVALVAGTFGVLACDPGDEPSVIGGVAARSTAGSCGSSATEGGADPGGGAGTAGTAGGAGAPAAGTAGTAGVDPATRALCVFDYDLTLSSNQCPQTEGEAGYFCRTNACSTYNWYDQCLGVAAQAAVAECVARAAFIGIASHAGLDACWNDKVAPIVTQAQFPELTGSANYDNPVATPAYPSIDDRDNWNCETCAYHMDANLGKPEGIRRIMRHYELNPDDPADRARVILWDDTSSNVDAVTSEMPEVKAILVARHNPSNADDGGCGISQADIDAGWAE